MARKASQHRGRRMQAADRKRGDQAEMVIMALSDGAKGLPEVAAQFIGMAARFGYFHVAEENDDFLEALRDDIELLKDDGLVTEANGVYSLTPTGREAAQKYLRFVASFRRFVDRVFLPETASIVAVATHLMLAALKLVAGILSGSIGLLSDGTDTLIDGLSSVLVFFGLRFDKERYVNTVLVLLMLAVGASLCAEAIRRFLEPYQPQVDLLSFVAIAASGVVCCLLWQYQRYVGARSGSLSLISQSIDSRNHVIVAAGVTVGLIAAIFNFGILDAVVGLCVAILILKTGFQLALETLRSLQGEEIDFSKYVPPVVERYAEHRHRRLAEWLLYVLATKGPLNRAELLHEAKETLDFSGIALLRELGLADDGAAEERIESAMAILVESEMVTPGDPFEATSEGRIIIAGILRQRRHHIEHSH